MRSIEKKTFDEERALYHLQNAAVRDCVFAGPADGESALKECRDVALQRCSFSLRYPLWHAHRFSLTDCTMDNLTRAALWYAQDGEITDCRLGGIKALRECDRMVLTRVTADSPEFGWKCRDITLHACTVSAEYAFLECKKAAVRQLQFKGKYAFQYTENCVIADSVLDTKDAFWHSENVTVKRCRLRGEYLGWYARHLTLIDCEIEGTQPLCYCEDLTLINCTMKNTDLAFEYSTVHADVHGEILSVKNPLSGEIVADSFGEIIEGDAIMETHCTVRTRT